jgi:hypothetical protein
MIKTCKVLSKIPVTEKGVQGVLIHAVRIALLSPVPRFPEIP